MKILNKKNRKNRKLIMVTISEYITTLSLTSICRWPRLEKVGSGTVEVILAELL